MAKDIRVDGRMKVDTFKDNFKETFGVSIRIYKGSRFADGSVTLSSIRAESAKGGKIEINGRTHVKNVEKMFEEEMGIKVQIENKDCELAENNVSLSSLKDSMAREIIPDIVLEDNTSQGLLSSCN